MSGWQTESRGLRSVTAQKMISEAQNEREKEQANTRLSGGLVGLADCTPPIGEPRRQTKTGNLLIFQTGKPQRNVSDELSNSPPASLCEWFLLLSCLVFSGSHKKW